MGIEFRSDAAHSRKTSETTDILEAVVSGKTREIATVREVGDSVLYHSLLGWQGAICFGAELCKSARQFTRNRATDVPEALVLTVQGEQRLLRTEAAVHVPERIMRQSASRIAHECFRLKY
jgi:hypothetical protein